MLKKNIKKIQKSIVFNHKTHKTPESFSIQLNQNPDAWLISYAKTVLDLIRQKEAVQ